LIWLDPNEVATYVTSINRSYIGQVIGGDWDLDIQSLDEHPKFVACRRHWLDGLSWEETGIIDLISDLVDRNGVQDDCRSREDVVLRYRALDELYELVRRDQRLRPRREVVVRGYRELGGILIHIGRDGRAIFGNSGSHRLAIAQVLDLEKIPALLGAVHVEALPIWQDKYLN
jgi:hypothetical protein